MGFGSFIGAVARGVSKHSPAICLVTSLVSGAATVVLACYETTKAGDILDKHKEEMDKIDKAIEVSSDEEYTEKDIKKDRIIVARNTTIGMARLYLPAILTGALSVVSALAGFRILRTRYVGATAALAAEQALFGKYRGRVIEDQGVEKDQQYLYGTKIEKGAIEETVVDPKTGKEKTVKKDKEVIDIDVDMQTCQIAVFGEKNPDGTTNYNWDENPDISLTYLRMKQQWFNDRLPHRKFISLNEVRKELGLNQTKAGQFVGWTYRPGRYVNFGLGDYSDPQVRRYVNGHQNYFVLHFNIDGEYEDNDDSFGENMIEAKPILDALGD